MAAAQLQQAMEVQGIRNMPPVRGRTSKKRGQVISKTVLSSGVCSGSAALAGGVVGLAFGVSNHVIKDGGAFPLSTMCRQTANKTILELPPS